MGSRRDQNRPDVGIWWDLDHAQAQRSRRHEVPSQCYTHLLHRPSSPAPDGRYLLPSTFSVVKAQQECPSLDLHTKGTFPILRLRYSLAGEVQLPLDGPCDVSRGSTNKKVSTALTGQMSGGSKSNSREG
jgi:hypothetical protein